MASDSSVKYYAIEYMNGQKRYDYAIIEFGQMTEPLPYVLQ
jgi:hypothetical protein